MTQSPRDDEETGARLDRHRFLKQEYVTIRDQDGARIRPIGFDQDKSE